MIERGFPLPYGRFLSMIALTLPFFNHDDAFRAIWIVNTDVLLAGISFHGIH